MSKTRFLAVPVVTLIVIGLLLVGGWAIHRIGWSQGYATGQLATGGQEAAIGPYAPYGLGYLGLFLMVGLVLLLLLVVIGKLFRFWAWTMVAGPWMMAGGPWKITGKPNEERWAKHWHRRHRPMHPCWWGWEKTSEEKDEAEPDAQTGAAKTQV
jgi:hypothetical protein